MSYYYWNSFHPDTQAAWDLHSEPVKAIILGLLKDPARRNLNDLTISVLRKIKSHYNSGRFFYACLRGSMTDPPYHHGALRGGRSFPRQYPGPNDSPEHQGTPGGKKFSNARLRFHDTRLFPHSYRTYAI